MLRWELYVNFFYSWIIFSLRCHQLNFQYYIEMNIHHRVRAFERSTGGKKKKTNAKKHNTNPPNPFRPPLCSSEHGRLPLVLQPACSPGASRALHSQGCSCSSPGIPTVGPWDLMGVKHKPKGLQDWGLQEQQEK